jgi:hypothetical protein
MESSRHLTASVSASLAGGWGNVRALPGWEGDVEGFRQLPNWIGLASPADLEQSTQLHTSSRSADVAFLIWTNQEYWRSRLHSMSVDTSATVYRLPVGSLSGRDYVAYTETSSFATGTLSTQISFFLPDHAAPALLVIFINHPVASMISTSTVEDYLSMFRLQPPKP